MTDGEKLTLLISSIPFLPWSFTQSQRETELVLDDLFHDQFLFPLQSPGLFYFGLVTTLSLSPCQEGFVNGLSKSLAILQTYSHEYSIINILRNQITVSASRQNAVHSLADGQQMIATAEWIFH